MTPPHTMAEASISEEGLGVAATPPLSHGSAAEPVPVSGKAGIANAFTPGPWRLERQTVYALDGAGNCNRFSARVEGGWVFRSAGSMGGCGDRTTEAELDANARLIAAAPELFEALALMQAEYDWAIAERALRKARGERL